MLFENANRWQAGALRLLNGFDEIGSGEIFPFDREWGLSEGAHTSKKYKNSDSRDASKGQFVSLVRIRGGRKR